MPTGAELIAAERERQVSEEGYNAVHDDEHDDEAELAMAAALYAAPRVLHEMRAGSPFDPWPWFRKYDKRPRDGNRLLPNNSLAPDARIRQLVKAGALIAAEIDRLERASGRAGK